MTYKYAIFDLDGTLLESMRCWREEEVGEMDSFAGGKIDKNTLEGFKTATYRQMILKAEKITGENFDRKEHTERIHQRMKAHYVNGDVTLKPHAAEFLEYLCSHGIKIAAATATPAELCVPCLEKYGIDKYFDFIFTTRQIGKSKDFPDIFDKACEALGAEKSLVMVFEDAYYSAKTLHDNDYRFTAISDASQTPEDLKFLRENAESYISDFSELMTFSLDSAAEFLLSNDDFLIAIHENPDGDCFGSALALSRVLNALGKSSAVLSACEIPERLEFLNTDEKIRVYVGSDGLNKAEESGKKHIMSVDVATPMLLGSLQPLIENRIEAAIDHHEINTLECENKYVDSKSAAAGEIVFRLLKLLEKITKRTLIGADAAFPLFAAISSDSGCFKYSNTTPQTMRIASELMETGIDSASVNYRLFDLKTKKQLDIEALAYKKLQMYEGGKIAFVYISDAELEALGAVHSDTETVVQNERCIAGVEIAAYMYQKEPNLFKFSVRSNSDCNVSDLCAVFGGGGHKRAAGCTISGSAETAAKAFIDEAVKRL